jgi:hypothetical protein
MGNGRGVGFPTWWVVFLDFVAPANDGRYELPQPSQFPPAVIEGKQSTSQEE